MSVRVPGARVLGLIASTALAVSALAVAGPAGARPVPRPHAGRAGAPAATGKRLVRGPHRAGNVASITNYTSNNWDGYFTTLNSHKTDFTAISATWTQAAVTCGTKESWAGFWVGFDGWWNGEVEQGGSEAHCISGTPHYNVWWEMFPFNSIQTTFAIAAGDTIHASVTYAPSTKKFTIVVQDVTSGKTLTKVTACRTGQHGCPRSSVEIISEDIGHFGGGLFPLPDYGTEAYSSASVTNTAGHTGSLSDPAWQLGDVTEVSGTITKQTTSALSPDGTSFSTTWHHA